MPVHDWTRVDAGIYHSFHLSWVAALKKVLNTGLLPTDYYALCEQHAGQHITHLLNAIPAGQRTPTDSPHDAYRELRRSVAIRHIREHRLIALVEILSPTNKDSAESIEEFADKVESALRAGVHVLLVDLFPRHARSAGDTRCRLASPGPVHRTLRSAGNQTIDLGSILRRAIRRGILGTHLGQLRLTGHAIVLAPDRYVNLPLEATYQEAYRGMPEFWRDVLEGRSDNTESI